MAEIRVAVEFERLTAALRNCGVALQDFGARLRGCFEATRELAEQWANPGEWDNSLRADLSRHVSVQRSFELLMEWLTPAQRLSYERFNCFEVIGSRSGRNYKIFNFAGFNVFWYAGSVTVGICFGPPGVPLYDIMLAQKLMLERDEDAALTVANWMAVQPFEFRCCEGKYADGWKEVAAFATEIKAPMRNRYGAPEARIPCGTFRVRHFSFHRGVLTREDVIMGNLRR